MSSSTEAVREVPAESAGSAPPEDFTRSWRYKLGLAMIIGGNGALVVGLLLPLFGLDNAALLGVLIIGGEVVSLLSIAFLGKEGFKAIKSKIFGFLKSTYTGPVSRARHVFGIVLLCTNVVTTYALAAYAWMSFEKATPEGPHPIVWGLDLAQQDSLVLTLFLVGDIAFLLAIYVLGADWWGRFRNIFVWHAPDAAPNSNAQ